MLALSHLWQRLHLTRSTKECHPHFVAQTADWGRRRVFLRTRQTWVAAASDCKGEAVRTQTPQSKDWTMIERQIVMCVIEGTSSKILMASIACQLYPIMTVPRFQDIVIQHILQLDTVGWRGEHSDAAPWWSGSSAQLADWGSYQATAARKRFRLAAPAMEAHCTLWLGKCPKGEHHPTFLVDTCWIHVDIISKQILEGDVKWCERNPQNGTCTKPCCSSCRFQVNHETDWKCGSGEMKLRGPLPLLCLLSRCTSLVCVDRQVSATCVQRKNPDVQRLPSASWIKTRHIQRSGWHCLLCLLTCVSLVLGLSNHNQGEDSDGTSVTLNRSHRLVLLRHHDLTATKPTPLPRVPWMFVHCKRYETMCAISAA